MVLKQLSVLIENKKGSLADVTTLIKDGEVNIRAIAAFDTPEYGILRVIVDKPEKAKDLLRENGYTVMISEVVAVELEDYKGALNEVLVVLEQADIQIDYIYSFVFRDCAKPLMILKVNQIDKCIDVLKDKNFTVALKNDIQS